MNGEPGEQVGGQTDGAGKARQAASEQPVALRRWYAFSWRRVGVFIAVVTAGLAILLHYDRAVYLATVGHDAQQQDWNRMLRVLGWAPLWLIAATVLAMHDWQYRRRLGWMIFSRFLLLSVPVLGTAGLSEVFKVVARRVRPMEAGGLMMWRSWQDGPWRSAGLSMPSGHAAVAFAGCLMLCHLFPRAKVIWVALAVGCAATRVLSGAHFLSDVFISAALAWAVVETTWLYHLKISSPWRRIAADLIVGPGTA